MKQDPAAKHFKAPDIFKEKGELERVAETFGIDCSVLLYQAERGQMKPLTEAAWSELDNTDSHDIGTGGWCRFRPGVNRLLT